MLQAIYRGVVRPELGIEIAQNSDADAVAHEFDCTRGAAVDYAESVTLGLEAWCGIVTLRAALAGNGGHSHDLQRALDA
jgi:hypothetical protein